MEANLNDKILIIGMVGLPARGKSYISRKIQRFSSWIGYISKIFNFGNYRRSIIGVNMDFNSFFDHSNQDSSKQRDECALYALQDLCEKANNQEINVGILDATNTTYDRRKLVKNYLEINVKVNYTLIWVESICNISEIIDNNIKETKIKSPDYINWSDKDKAIEDFKHRIIQYEEVYKPINAEVEGSDMRFVKIIDQGRRIQMNNIFGYLESKLTSYLVNLHTGDRAIYFTRHGESLYNLSGQIGGNSSLSVNGVKYAKALSKFFANQFEGINDRSKLPKLFCSTLKRTIETCEYLLEESHIFCKYSSQKCLDELSAGRRDGLTYEELKEKYPLEHEERHNDKLNYRYPRGESYMDVISRIEPMIFEIERSKIPLVIVGHQAMLRCLYGYFNNTPIEKIPTLDIPLNTIIKFKPKDYGFEEERFYINKEGEIQKIDLNQVRIGEELPKLNKEESK